jgi:predicted alpha/beta superfamily hydrolase
MGYLDPSRITVRTGTGGTSAPVIYLVDSPEHPFEEPQQAHALASTVVTLPIASWGDALTPWPAAGPYRDDPAFGGHAADTLAQPASEVMPHVETTHGLSPTRRAICGYSLGGLFSLYALTHSTGFDACGCLSGSVWYEGWVDHLAAMDLQLGGRFAFLSLGTKEKRGGTPLMRTVQDRMQSCERILRDHGCEVVFVTSPGNHMQHVPERIATGLQALDGFLAR